MRSRQPPPRIWLMTDERMGDLLWRAVERLPRGSGIVFRHYRTPIEERRALFARVRRAARRRRLVLVLAGDARRAAAWRADGVHGGARRDMARPLLRTAAAHDGRALVLAIRAGADLIFLSPVFPTMSHPGAPALGPVRFGLLARIGGRRRRLIAPGGMNPHRGRRMTALGAAGWAAIDAWTAPPADAGARSARTPQNLKVVPR